MNKYELYERSFQQPEQDIRFLDNTFLETVGRLPKVLREDFCGTAANCLEWIRSGEERRAIGVDIDPEPLDWCREQKISGLSADIAKRLELVNADVLSANTGTADIILAANCSICALKDRHSLLQYFESAHRHLEKDGMFVMDIYGGPDAIVMGADRFRRKGTSVIWEQAYFNQITHESVNYIHFELDSGERLTKAFEYNWRFWMVAELIDALKETGFHRIQVFKRSDFDGENGSFSRLPCYKLTTEAHWTVDIVACK